MTLAHELATGQRTRADVIDEGFKKRAFKDRDGLPDWFLDDEGKHDKAHKPITKAAADAITAGGFVLDYVEARHAETLAPVASGKEGPLRLLVAARIGKTRLIDNIGV